MKALSGKWWVTLIQGILLIILCGYVFNRSGIALFTMAFWISLLILCTGLTGIIGSLMIRPEDRETTGLLWCISSMLFGILLLGKIGIAMELITKLLGIWMIITGAWLIQQGWTCRNNAAGWITFVMGVLSVLAGCSLSFDIKAGSMALNTIVALQLLGAGIGLIILSLLKRFMAIKTRSADADMHAMFK